MIHVLITYFGDKRQKSLIAAVVTVYCDVPLILASPRAQRETTAATINRLTVVMVGERFNCYGLDMWRGGLPSVENLVAWRHGVYAFLLEMATS